MKQINNPLSKFYYLTNRNVKREKIQIINKKKN